MRTWPLVGALLFFNTFDLASAGEKGSGTSAAGKRKSREVSDGALIEELTAATFAEKVEQVVNGTGKLPYTPVVMFHMPWCEHCKKTIPELQETAEKVAEAAAQGQLRQYPATPRIFMLSCAEQGVDDICNTYSAKSYPSIIAFRGGRAMKFNRPRVASVITWWVFRVTRPSISLVERREHLDAGAQNEVVFLLHLKSEADMDSELSKCWNELALDHIESYQFLFTLSSKPLGKSLGTAPSVHVYGPESMGLDPLPTTAPLTEDALKMWVTKNQFPPVVEVLPWTMMDLRKSELAIVSLVFADNAAGRNAVADFAQKAKKLRHTTDYIFATINGTDQENTYFLNNKLPLLTAGLPRIFVFKGVSGEVHFWEDPKFTSVEGLSVEAIESLMSDPEAFHDEPSWWSWAKTKRKQLTRFALRSSGALFLTVATPIVGLAFFYYCCKTMWAALNEDEEQDTSKHDHVD